MAIIEIYCLQYKKKIIKKRIFLNFLNLDKIPQESLDFSRFSVFFQEADTLTLSVDGYEFGLASSASQDIVGRRVITAGLLAYCPRRGV